MAKLTEAQTALLRMGIAHPEGTIDVSRQKARPAAALSGVLGALRRKGLAAKAGDGVWRVTDAGRETINAEPHAAAPLPVAVEPLPAANENAVADQKPGPSPASKRGRLLALLWQEGGADMAALTAATGWQAHSVRALLSGLRKAGMTVVCEKQPGGASRYRILSEQEAI